MDKLCLLCELGQLGDLRKALLDPATASKMTCQVRIRIALGVVSALNYLHCHIASSPVFHRDVKSANVVLFHGIVAKLTDLGLAKGVETEARAAGHSTFSGNSAVGTPGYMCPMYGVDGHYDAQSEIYSVGIVLFEILAGRCQGEPVPGSGPFYFQAMFDSGVEVQPDTHAGEWDADCVHSVQTLATSCIAPLSTRPRAMVEVLHTLRELEQRYCRGVAEELEHYRRKYEQLRAQVMSEERARQCSAERSRRECLICFDVKTVGEGVECRGSERHFVCRDCFSDQVRVQSGADNRGRFKSFNSSIVCAFCTEPFPDGEVASRCSPEAWTLYRRARDEVLITREQEQHQLHIAQLRDELSRLNGRNAAVHRHRLHIVENILTLHCPREGCRAAVFDFDGCFAVSCSNCRAGFCGWCMRDCGGDAHAHVKQCDHSLHRGSFYGSQEEFNQAHRQRRGAAVTAYLAFILDGEEKSLLEQQIQGDLRDLGIALTG